MIKYKELRWSNAFSYGPGNVIRLDDASLVQLLGANGNGKSSIALVLEEVQFNTNSKKIKKSDILNRYTNSKNYTIELDFEKDGTDYKISTTRTSTSGSVSLSRNGSDISAHTATGTYKLIEQILGYDHKVFSQIVYQSSVSSLEFLTAPDTARKKFLIELLNLGKYTAASEVFKELASNLSKSVESTQVKVHTVKSWLAKYEKEDLRDKEIVEELEYPKSVQERITMLKHELDNIEATNKKITKNNTFSSILANIEIGEKPEEVPASVLMELNLKLADKTRTLKEGSGLCSKHNSSTSKCPTCSQLIDNSAMFNMAKAFEAKRDDLEQEIMTITKTIAGALIAQKNYKAYQDRVTEWEKYHALFDPKMPTTLLDRAELVSDIASLEKSVGSILAAIEVVRKCNTLAAAHNSKAAVIRAQMGDMQTELVALNSSLVEEVDELTKLQILVKAFSTTGLVAYKIECLVKDLEELTNQYLAKLADGRFQLSFKIAGADKLNVVITDNGNDIDILALSSGERARVNVSTLLAIRKLMQALSNSRTNLLILDETVENLDVFGKEKLIETLLEEQDLNTILISHSFTHPLIEKLDIVKTDGISRIER